MKKLSFTVKSDSTYTTLFERLKSDSGLRRQFTKDTNNTDLSVAKGKYALNEYELLKLRQDILNFNTQTVSSQTKLIVTRDTEDRVAPVMFNIEGVQSFMNKGYELEKQRNLTRMDIHKNMVKSVCSLFEIKNDKVVPSIGNQQVGKNLQMDDGSIRMLAGAFNVSKPTTTADMNKLLHNSLNGKDEDGKQALELVKSLPPVASRIGSSVTAKGTVVLTPAKIGVKIPSKARIHCVESLLTKVGTKSSYAEVCNKHVYGKDFGGLNPYLDFVVDAENILAEIEDKKCPLIVHHKAYNYALLLSRRTKRHVYFLGSMEKKMMENLTCVNSIKIKTIAGVHFLLDTDSVSCESGGNIWDTNAEADKDKRELFNKRASSAKYKDFHFIRRIGIFAMHDGRYYPSVRMRDKFVWQNHDNIGFSRKKMLDYAAEFLLNWYLFPWTYYTAVEAFEWIPLIEGEYSLKLTKKQADRFNFVLNDSEVIDRFLKVRLEDGEEEESKSSHSSNKKVEVEESDEEEELDDGDEMDDEGWS